MSEEKTLKKKVRILQRDDGKVFPHSAQLEVMPHMRPGWKKIYDDKTSEIILDAATAQQLNPNSVSKREQMLIEENAMLREQLAQAQGMIKNPETFAPPAVPMQPGETPLPSKTNAVDLTAPPPIDDDEPIQFAPEPEMHSESKLSRTKNADLIAYAKELNHEVVIPADAEKDDLVALCLEQQAIYKAKVEG